MTDQRDTSAEEALAHPGGGLRARLRSVAVDVSPLRRHREFRLLYVGQAISFVGTELSVVAMPYQVYRITHSSLAVGLLALCHLVPMLTLSLVGGALADAVDRRALFLRAEAAAFVVSVLLMLNSIGGGGRLWVVYVLAAARAGADALGRPALWSMIPRIVPREDLPAALNLNSMYYNFGAAAGPALAGVLLAAFGLTATYGIDALTFVAALAALARMRPVPPADDVEGMSARTILDGLRYARRKPVLLGTYLVDYNAMVFGMPRALFPALALGRFHGGAGILGLLYGAPYFGALLASATSGWMPRVRRQGVAIIVSVAVWGFAVIGFGLAPSLWFALAMLAVAGAADLVSAVFRGTIWNTTIPDAVRGRLAGIEFANVTSGPALGDVEAGVMASATSVRFSIVSGGVACLVGAAVLACTLPALVRYDSANPTLGGDEG